MSADEARGVSAEQVLIIRDADGNEVAVVAGNATNVGLETYPLRYS